MCEIWRDISIQSITITKKECVMTYSDSYPFLLFSAFLLPSFFFLSLFPSFFSKYSSNTYYGTGVVLGIRNTEMDKVWFHCAQGVYPVVVKYTQAYIVKYTQSYIVKYTKSLQHLCLLEPLWTSHPKSIWQPFQLFLNSKIQWLYHILIIKLAHPWWLHIPVCCWL